MASFKMGVPQGVGVNLWLQSDDDGKIQILNDYFQFKTMQSKLRHLVNSNPNAFNMRFADLLQGAHNDIVNYFNIRPHDIVSNTIENDEDSLVSRAWHAIDWKEIQFEVKVAAHLSKPNAGSFFEKWHATSPLAGYSNGNLVPLKMLYLLKAEPTSIFVRLFEMVDFEKNKFVTWPESLKEVVYVNLSDRTKEIVKAISRVPQLKELAFGRLSQDRQKDIKARHDANQFRDWAENSPSFAGPSP